MEQYHAVYLTSDDITALRQLLAAPSYKPFTQAVPGLLPALTDPLPESPADVVRGEPPLVVSLMLTRALTPDSEVHPYYATLRGGF